MSKVAIDKLAIGRTTVFDFLRLTPIALREAIVVDQTQEVS
jgi:hypothetical protein